MVPGRNSDGKACWWKRFSWGLAFGVLGVWMGATVCTASRLEAAWTVVVYNTEDPFSGKIARYYAKRRQIPQENLIGLSLPLTETCSQTVFEEKLEQPLLRILEERNFVHRTNRLWRLPHQTQKRLVPFFDRVRVLYIVLCRGVPLRIARESMDKGASKTAGRLIYRNEAAVDSELASMAFRLAGVSINGPMANPAYRSTNRVERTHSWRGVFYVARLDGPTPEDAMALVDRALEAESSGVGGRAYIDLRGLTSGGYVLGDKWLRKAWEVAQNWGFDCVVDQDGAVLPEGRPMPYPFLYAGWYARNLCGPWLDPDLEIPPGAIAYHIHSFSASTLRSTSRGWVGPLIHRGVTASIGYVYEPYLGGTIDVGIFWDRLLNHGMTFGEAAYAAMPTLSWQTTVVGDPLYRPFPPGSNVKALQARTAWALAWKYVYETNQRLQAGANPVWLAQELIQHPVSRRFSFLQEKIGDLYGKANQWDKAFQHYKEALRLVREVHQQRWLHCKLAHLQAERKEWKAALEEVDQYLEALDEISPDPLFLKEAIEWAKQAKDSDRLARYQKLLAQKN